MKREISKSTYIFYSSILIAVIYNLFTIPLKQIAYVDVSLGRFVVLFLSEISAVFVATVVVLFLFSFNRVLLKTATLIFIIISSISSYFVFKYKLFIDALLIGTILETNSAEIAGIISFDMVLWGIFCLLLPVYIFGFYFKIKSYVGIVKFSLLTIKDAIILGAMALLVFIFSYVSNSTMYKLHKGVRNSLIVYNPINYVAGIWQYVTLLRYMVNKDLIDISKEYKFEITDKVFLEQPYNVIFIIGESARADRQSLNGYFRDTNSYLKKIENLTSFGNVTSCGTLSRVSITCVLSYKNREDFTMFLTETNIISVFNSFGFETSFLSAQPMQGEGVNYFYLAAKEAHTVVFHNNLRARGAPGQLYNDGDLMPFVDDAISSKNPHKFITMYLIGSHTPYSRRYPKQFNVYGNKVSDEYDSSVLYTSYFLKQVIDKFKDTNTLLYYVSDHGESLGENGIFLHGAPYETAPKEQINVAQFIWVSDGMKKLLGKKYNNIVAHKNDNLSHDNVFHTLLDCISVSSSLVQKDLSLCASKSKK